MGFYEDLGAIAKLVSFDKNYRIKDFKCKIDEYNEFLLNQADLLHEEYTSRTLLLINKQNADVVGYMSLATASIQLTEEETTEHEIIAPFPYIPTLKIGKLAIDERYSNKGYGSLLIYLARGIAEKLVQLNIGCRFIDVDADVQYDEGNIEFYKKNDFIFNEHKDYSRKTKNLSMRLEFLTLQDAVEKTG